MNQIMRMTLTKRTEKIEGPSGEVVRLVHEAIDGLNMKMVDAITVVANAECDVDALGSNPSPYDKTLAVDALNTANARVRELNNRIQQYRKMLADAAWK